MYSIELDPNESRICVSMNHYGPGSFVVSVWPDYGEDPEWFHNYVGMYAKRGSQWRAYINGFACYVEIANFPFGDHMTMKNCICQATLEGYDLLRLELDDHDDVKALEPCRFAQDHEIADPGLVEDVAKMMERFDPSMPIWNEVTDEDWARINKVERRRS